MPQNAERLGRDETGGQALGILPQSLMESATAPPTEAAPVEVEPARASNGNDPTERPFKEGLLVRLGHRLCGFGR